MVNLEDRLGIDHGEGEDRARDIATCKGRLGVALKLE